MTDELALTIDHLTLSVADIAKAKAFYEKALAPAGLELVAELTPDITGGAHFVAFGKGRKGNLWIAATGHQTPTTHFCFRVGSRAAVRAFHEQAIAAGGVDNGAPGVREMYHPEYYAAFVTDPEGHNVECVTFDLAP
ncbi:VOC family protein [Pyruvatibacter sp. HU-CL02332]|uniref:VOC family protein n=1 Tax=Pyruvatibacter sp. HU-CL02332 TaxID=3127650 RepID=UPI00310BB220